MSPNISVLHSTFLKQVFSVKKKNNMPFTIKNIKVHILIGITDILAAAAADDDDDELLFYIPFNII